MWEKSLHSIYHSISDYFSIKHPSTFIRWNGVMQKKWCALWHLASPVEALASCLLSRCLGSISSLSLSLVSPVQTRVLSAVSVSLFCLPASHLMFAPNASQGSAQAGHGSKVWHWAILIEDSLMTLESLIKNSSNKLEYIHDASVYLDVSTANLKLTSSEKSSDHTSMC